MSYSYTIPKLYSANDTITKSWFVFFWIDNPHTNKRERYRVSERLNQLKTVAERKQYAKVLIARYKKRLQRGWNPFAEKEPVVSVPEPVTSPETVFKAYPIKKTLFTLLETRKGELRKKGYQTNESKVRIFCNWLRDRKMHEMDVRDFTAQQAFDFWDSKNHLHPNTCNRYLVTLKGLFEELKRREIIIKNPFKAIKRKSFQSKPFLPFKQYHVDKLKVHLPEHEPQLWLFIQFMYWAFLRPGRELRLLTIGNIDFEEWSIRVPGDTAKNKKTQSVLINNRLKEAIQNQGLQEYPEHYYVFGKGGKPGLEPQSDNYFANTHRNALKALGISTEHKLYSWKPTGIIAAWKNGMDLKQLQSMVRHHSLDQLNQYMRTLGITDMEDVRSKDIPL